MKDDISLQAPGKGDTIIVRINGQKKIWHRKAMAKKAMIQVHPLVMSVIIV